MPTYQYACTECDHRFEQVQSFTDDSLTECPVCHGRLRKVFNAVGVVFKGSGFYRNDSRPTPDASSSEGGGSSSDGGSSTADSSTSSGGEKTTSSDTSASSSEKKAAAPAEKKTSPSSSEKAS